MTDAPISFLARVWLALVCALRVVIDPRLAGRVNALVAASGSPEPGTAEPVVPAAAKAEPPPAQAGPAPNQKPPVAAASTEPSGALGLLALLQREGRLIDFLKQEIDAFADADVGSAARVVHAGCRKALLGAFDVAKIRPEAEGSAITVPEGFDGRSVKLTGNVRGSAPYRGVLRHAGWRVDAVRLPALVAGYDATIIAPAEVEL